MTGPMPPAYTVKVDRGAAKLLRKLDRPMQARLVTAIADLATDPRPARVKALTGHPASSASASVPWCAVSGGGWAVG